MKERVKELNNFCINEFIMMTFMLPIIILVWIVLLPFVCADLI